MSQQQIDRLRHALRIYDSARESLVAAARDGVAISDRVIMLADVNRAARTLRDAADALCTNLEIEDLTRVHSLDTDPPNEVECVLWWTLPVCEPPYVGSLLDEALPQNFRVPWNLTDRNSPASNV